jgi:hypothetical protein
MIVVGTAPFTRDILLRLVVIGVGAFTSASPRLASKDDNLSREPAVGSLFGIIERGKARDDVDTVVPTVRSDSPCL